MGDRRYKDCPKCRLSTTPGSCAFCEGQGSVPRCPPVGEPVVFNFPAGPSPMTVAHAELRGDPATVFVKGLVFEFGKDGSVQPHNRIEIQGPSEQPGCWNWRGDPS